MHSVEAVDLKAAGELESLLRQRLGAAHLLQDHLEAAGRMYRRVRAIDESIYRMVAPNLTDGGRSALRLNGSDLGTVAAETLHISGAEFVPLQSPGTRTLLPLAGYIARQSERIREIVG